MSKKKKNLLPLPPRAPGPKFITSERVWSLKELADMYGNDICKCYMLTHDYHGALVDRKLDKGDLVYLVCASVQTRVVVRCRIGPGVERLFSFSYEMDLGKYQQDMGEGRFVSETGHFVYDAVRSNKDPIIIRLAPTYSGGIPSPTFEFLTKYDDVTILANPIVKDKVGPDLLYMPVCAHNVRLQEVTGIENKDKSFWDAWLNRINKESCEFEYDLQYSTSEVAVFDPSVIDPRNVTCETPVRCYIELQKLVSELTEECTKFAEPPNIYERPELDDAIYNVPEDDGVHDYEEPVDMNNYESAKLNAELKKAFKKKSKQEEMEEENTLTAPELPERNRAVKQHKDQANSSSNSYGNIIPRGQAKPVTRSISQQSSSSERETTKHEDVSRLDVVPATGEDVSKLSITDLSHCLTLLKLDKYVEDFVENFVDGPILQELSAKDLMETFGMSKIEAVRLEKFAKEAHIPRR